ncbi:jg5853 [Pararge aegeria aegeria]|uniref:Jg5853 protein n=1 Tax=Pararge aegeria aegeria TaxID=348720 RepID=A0A8S4SBV8_9NEOP|nr:jg5853 [Pararge aegeria aegeria]
MDTTTPLGSAVVNVGLLPTKSPQWSNSSHSYPRKRFRTQLLPSQRRPSRQTKPHQRKCLFFSRHLENFYIISGYGRGTELGEPLDVGVPRCLYGNPAQVNAALVGSQLGGQTPSNESLGAAGNKRPRTVDFGTLYKRPMSSSGLQSVEVMMMICHN